MALPKQSSTIYSTIIPSTDTPIKFKPFLVKQEKALLLAQQSEDQMIMLDTLKDILSDCIIDKVNINSLAMFDIEYLLLQIRARSIGEIVELIFSCDVCDDPKAKVKYSFDVSKIEVKKDPDHTKKISLFDEVGVVMKYPGLEDIKKIESLDLDDIDNIFDVIINSIDYIYDGNEIHHTKDQSKEELMDFLNNLTQVQFQKLRDFFKTMPKLRQDVKYKCPVCGLEHNKYLQGLDTFF
jgi:hypothetical protein